MRVAILTVAAFVCAACCSRDERRLNMIDVDPGDVEVWYDNERRETCTAWETEHNGTRCFPRFTAIDPDHLRYADAACETLAVWVELEQPWHAYVAYVADDERLVYSIFRIIEPALTPNGGAAEPHALLDGECAPHPIEFDLPAYKVTTRIHPEEFSPVEP